jgi:prepilin-type N-terminal cleavage/methylation domain-containing protein
MHERPSHAGETEHGVSLVELLVTVAVVGVLATLLVPSLVTSVRNAREARAIGNVRAIAGAEMEVYARERRFAIFEELFRLGALPNQLAREASGGGPRGSGSEVVSDGVYAYSLRFDREAVGITVDADPQTAYRGTHRWFRLRLGRMVRSASGGEMVVYVAEPSPRSPPPEAYRPLGR